MGWGPLSPEEVQRVVLSTITMSFRPGRHRARGGRSPERRFGSVASLRVTETVVSVAALETRCPASWHGGDASLELTDL
jgi:hypothetical protein